MTDAVILLCPVCASTVDAVAAEAEQQLTCVSCGQTWVMVVDRERHDTHSLS